jgi:cytochrome c-type biogenesis protein CcmH
MTRFRLLILLASVAIALVGYFFMGRPGLGDLPMAARQDKLAEKIRLAPESLTQAETLSRLEAALVEDPKAPEPHYFIGRMMESEGRYEEAARAYQSALRRDEDYVPALVALGDVLFENSGRVDTETRAFYRRAYELDATQVQAGMRAAMGAAEAGDQATASSEMRAIYEALPDADPRRERFRPMYEAITTPQKQPAPP